MTGNELASCYESWMTPDGLRALRRGLRLTQPQLAERLDVAPTTVGRWEQGRKTPTIRHLVRLRYLVEGRTR